MTMNVKHNLLLANAVELLQISNVKYFKIIISIIKVANYYKKLFANNFFNSFNIFPYSLLFLNLFLKHLSILILEPLDLI